MNKIDSYHFGGIVIDGKQCYCYNTDFRVEIVYDRGTTKSKGAGSPGSI